MRKLSAIVFILWSISAVATAQQMALPAASDPASDNTLPARPAAKPEHSGGIHWGSLMREWWMWVATEQTERIVRETKTRNQLSGPFFGDWFKSVSDYHFDNWNDGGKVFTSYLAHPTQGAVAEALFWQNNDHVRFTEQDFHSATYRHALLQAFAFAAVDAVMWKMGPLSESSIGNVGMPVHYWDKDCKQLRLPCVDRTGMSDMVMNEVLGTGLTVAFQWLDKHVQKGIESRSESRAWIDTTRILTNPPASVANLMRFRRPWYRDNRRDE
jgi:hypothetical protein